MNIKAKVTSPLLMTVAGLMVAAGCGPAQDGTESAAVAKSAVDIPALKAAALSNIANSPCVARVGNGCVAEMTIDSTMQRVVSETLCRAAALPTQTILELVGQFSCPSRTVRYWRLPTAAIPMRRVLLR